MSEEKVNEGRLVEFPCPAFSNAGLHCTFASMKEVKEKTGLRCKNKACQIRVPL